MTLGPSRPLHSWSLRGPGPAWVQDGCRGRGCGGGLKRRGEPEVAVERTAVWRTSGSASRRAPPRRGRSRAPCERSDATSGRSGSCSCPRGGKPARDQRARPAGRPVERRPGQNRDRAGRGRQPRRRIRPEARDLALRDRGQGALPGHNPAGRPGAAGRGDQRARRGCGWSSPTAAAIQRAVDRHYTVFARSAKRPNARPLGSVATARSPTSHRSAPTPRLCRSST